MYADLVGKEYFKDNADGINNFKNYAFPIAMQGNYIQSQKWSEL